MNQMSDETDNKSDSETEASYMKPIGSGGFVYLWD